MVPQEDGWVVCRVFKKKNHNRGYQPEFAHHQDQEHDHFANMKASGSHAPVLLDHHEPKQNHHHLEALCDYTSNFDHAGSMHLPQLFSPESAVASSFVSPNTINLNTMDIECSQNLLRLTSTAAAAAGCGQLMQQQERSLINGGDWSFLDKLLTSHQSLDHHHSSHTRCNNPSSSAQQQLNNSHEHVGTSSTTQQRFPFQYLGCGTDLLKFSK